jgi:hypothetical protein
MSDSAFDAARLCGEYPPKGWGWKSVESQRMALADHFERPRAVIEPWMHREADRLGVPLPNMGLKGAKTLGDSRVSSLMNFKWPRI